MIAAAGWRAAALALESIEQADDDATAGDWKPRIRDEPER